MRAASIGEQKPRKKKFKTEYVQYPKLWIFLYIVLERLDNNKFSTNVAVFFVYWAGICFVVVLVGRAQYFLSFSFFSCVRYFCFFFFSYVSYYIHHRWAAYFCCIFFARPIDIVVVFHFIRCICRYIYTPKKRLNTKREKNASVLLHYWIVCSVRCRCIYIEFDVCCIGWKKVEQTLNSLRPIFFRIFRIIHNSFYAAIANIHHFHYITNFLFRFIVDVVDGRTYKKKVFELLFSNMKYVHIRHTLPNGSHIVQILQQKFTIRNYYYFCSFLLLVSFVI